METKMATILIKPSHRELGRVMRGSRVSQGTAGTVTDSGTRGLVIPSRDNTVGPAGEGGGFPTLFFKHNGTALFLL